MIAGILALATGMVLLIDSILAMIDMMATVGTFVGSLTTLGWVASAAYMFGALVNIVLGSLLLAKKSIRHNLVTLTITNALLLVFVVVVASVVGTMGTLAIIGLILIVLTLVSAILASFMKEIAAMQKSTSQY